MKIANLNLLTQYYQCFCVLKLVSHQILRFKAENFKFKNNKNLILAIIIWKTKNPIYKILME